MDNYTPLKFQMVNDQSGETETHTLDTFADASGRGFRVLQPHAYDNAVVAQNAAREAAMKAAVPELPDYAAERNYADALLIARTGYPDADGGPDAEGVDLSVSPGMETGPQTQGQPPAAGADVPPGTTPVAGESYDEEAFRAGLSKGTHAQLDTYAEQEGYDLAGAKTIQDKVDAIVAQRNEREAGGESEGDDDESE